MAKKIKTLRLKVRQVDHERHSTMDQSVSFVYNIYELAKAYMSVGMPVGRISLLLQTVEKNMTVLEHIKRRFGRGYTFCWYDHTLPDLGPQYDLDDPMDVWDLYLQGYRIAYVIPEQPSLEYSWN